MSEVWLAIGITMWLCVGIGAMFLNLFKISIKEFMGVKTDAVHLTLMSLSIIALGPIGLAIVIWG
jgi:hypothetical protein